MLNLWTSYLTSGALTVIQLWWRAGVGPKLRPAR
jgi:hypothetical protein